MSYEPPTGKEFRELLKWLGLTRSQAGELLAVSGRVIGRYCGTDVKVPFGALYTLLHRCEGITVTPSGWRFQLANKLDQGVATGERSNEILGASEQPALRQLAGENAEELEKMRVMRRALEDHFSA